jgi:hypothetical protein
MDFSKLPHFDATFCFGFLYHSPHPFWILKRLATITDHLFLTTKVFDHSEAYAYFYDIAECNNDATNWWCFTPKALALMLKRAGFTVVLLERLDENIGKSHPVDLRHDGRVFVYARRSTRGDELLWQPPVVIQDKASLGPGTANSKIRSVLSRTYSYFRAVLSRQNVK